MRIICQRVTTSSRPTVLSNSLILFLCRNHDRLEREEYEQVLNYHKYLSTLNRTYVTLGTARVDYASYKWHGEYFVHPEGGKRLFAHQRNLIEHILESEELAFLNALGFHRMEELTLPQPETLVALNPSYNYANIEAAISGGNTAGGGGGVTTGDGSSNSIGGGDSGNGNTFFDSCTELYLRAPGPFDTGRIVKICFVRNKLYNNVKLFAEPMDEKQERCLQLATPENIEAEHRFNESQRLAVPLIITLNLNRYGVTSLSLAAYNEIVQSYSWKITHVFIDTTFSSLTNLRSSFSSRHRSVKRQNLYDFLDSASRNNDTLPSPDWHNDSDMSDVESTITVDPIILGGGDDSDDDDIDNDNNVRDVDLDAGNGDVGVDERYGQRQRRRRRQRYEDIDVSVSSDDEYNNDSMNGSGVNEGDVIIDRGNDSNGATNENDFRRSRRITENNRLPAYPSSNEYYVMDDSGDDVVSPSVSSVSSTTTATTARRMVTRPIINIISSNSNGSTSTTTTSRYGTFRSSSSSVTTSSSRRSSSQPPPPPPPSSLSSSMASVSSHTSSPSSSLFASSSRYYDSNTEQPFSSSRSPGTGDSFSQSSNNIFSRRQNCRRRLFDDTNDVTATVTNNGDNNDPRRNSNSSGINNGIANNSYNNETMMRQQRSSLSPVRMSSSVIIRASGRVTPAVNISSSGGIIAEETTMTNVAAAMTVSSAIGNNRRNGGGSVGFDVSGVVGMLDSNNEFGHNGSGGVGSGGNEEEEDEWDSSGDSEMHEAILRRQHCRFVAPPRNTVVVPRTTVTAAATSSSGVAAVTTADRGNQEIAATAASFTAVTDGSSRRRCRGGGGDDDGSGIDDTSRSNNGPCGNNCRNNGNNGRDGGSGTRNNRSTATTFIHNNYREHWDNSTRERGSVIIGNMERDINTNSNNIDVDDVAAIHISVPLPSFSAIRMPMSDSGNGSRPATVAVTATDDTFATAISGRHISSDPTGTSSSLPLSTMLLDDQSFSSDDDFSTMATNVVSLANRNNDDNDTTITTTPSSVDAALSLGSPILNNVITHLYRLRHQYLTLRMQRQFFRRQWRQQRRQQQQHQRASPQYAELATAAVTAAGRRRRSPSFVSSDRSDNRNSIINSVINEHNNYDADGNNGTANTPRNNYRHARQRHEGERGISSETVVSSSPTLVLHSSSPMSHSSPMPLSSLSTSHSAPVMSMTSRATTTVMTSTVANDDNEEENRDIATVNNATRVIRAASNDSNRRNKRDAFVQTIHSRNDSPHHYRHYSSSTASTETAANSYQLSQQQQQQQYYHNRHHVSSQSRQQLCPQHYYDQQQQQQQQHQQQQQQQHQQQQQQQYSQQQYHHPQSHTPAATMSATTTATASAASASAMTALTRTILTEKIVPRGYVNTIFYHNFGTGRKVSITSLCMHEDSRNNWIIIRDALFDEWINTLNTFAYCKYHCIRTAEEVRDFVKNFGYYSRACNIVLIDSYIAYASRSWLMSVLAYRVFYCDHQYKRKLNVFGCYNYVVSWYAYNDMFQCNRHVQFNVVNVHDMTVERMYSSLPEIQFVEKYVQCSRENYMASISVFDPNDEITTREENRRLIGKILEHEYKLRDKYLSDSQSILLSEEQRAACNAKYNTVLSNLAYLQKKITQSSCVVCLSRDHDYYVPQCCRNPICVMCFQSLAALDCPSCREKFRCGTLIPFVLPRVERTESSASFQNFQSKQNLVLHDLRTVLQRFVVSRSSVQFFVPIPKIVILDYRGHVSKNVIMHMRNYRLFTLYHKDFSKFKMSPDPCVLLVNRKHALSGLDLSFATHLFILHKLGKHESVYILSRFQRYGRIASLQVKQYLNFGDTSLRVKVNRLASCPIYLYSLLIAPPTSRYELMNLEDSRFD